MTTRIGYSLIASQNVAFGGTSAQSTALTAATRQVRLVASSDCYIAIGTNPTATTSSTLLLAGSPEYFQVRGGELVAVIQSTASGTLNLTEVGR